MLVILFSNVTFAAFLSSSKKISFFLQPHETAGTECTYESTNQPHGYFVVCGQRTFRVHHFIHSHQNQEQNQWEILFWVTNFQNSHQNENVGTTLWVKGDTKSNMQTFKLSQAIDNDTATLDLTIQLDDPQDKDLNKK